jgi:uncharacterized protein (TIGR02217 family)
MTTIDAELDLTPDYGWQVQPEFNTLIKQLRSGRERRRSLWGYVKHRYTLPFNNITDASYLNKLKSVFLACRGSTESFIVKDYSDYLATAEIFGAGDGTETQFDLFVVSIFGSASYARRVFYPVNPVFYVNGVPAAASVDGGVVTFSSAPADSSVLSWSGEFRVPVRFATDTFPMTIDNRSGDNYVMNGSVDLLEVWE